MDTEMHHSDPPFRAACSLRILELAKAADGPLPASPISPEAHHDSGSPHPMVDKGRGKKV